MNKLWQFLSKYKLRLALSLIVLIAIGWGLSQFLSTEKLAAANPIVPVTVEQVQQKTMTVNLTAVGKVYPYSTVAVRSQVEGPIVSIDFQRGQDVKIGDVLFSIDPRPFEVALQQAQANLEREQALLTEAQANFKRIEPLLSKKYISQENYDQVYSALKAQEASVHEAEANLANAQLQLDYCTIRSPIEGRTGDILVHIGNQVKANDTQALVIINQLNPIFVSFDIPEKFLPAINRRLSEGKLPVVAKDVNNEVLSNQGELFFVDNTIDALTGTIELKANFANERDELWPGQFTNVELGLYQVENAIIIPTRAIQYGQKGSYVFVINAANKAEYRSIQIAEAIDDSTIVTQGLDVNEQVVVDGQFRLIDGSEVKLS
jgi:multidrug efflux system membrane fusion protein